MQNEYKGIVLQESRYMQWNEEVRENRVRIWHWNCSGGGGKFGLRCKLVCGWTNFEGGWHSIGDKSFSRVNNGGFEWVGTIRMGTRLESACGDESNGPVRAGMGRVAFEWERGSRAMRRGCDRIRM